MTTINFTKEQDTSKELGTGIYHVKRKSNGADYLAIVADFTVGTFVYGVMFISGDGNTTYSSRKYLSENFSLVKEVKEITLL